MRRVIVAIFLFMMLAGTASATPTKIRMEPNTIQVDEGKTFTVSFYVTPAETINTLAIDKLSWSPDILDVVSVDKGTIFSDATIWIDGKNKNPDNISYICWASTQSATEPGLFLNITFRATATGSCIIHIDKFGVAYAGNDLEKQVENDCTVNVGEGTAVVEPQNKTPPPSVSIYFIIAIIFIIIMSVVVILTRKRGRVGTRPKKEFKGGE